MKKQNKIIYIALIFVIIAMIAIGYLILTKNGIIIKQGDGETKAASETTGDNSYITTEQHLTEVSNSGGLQFIEISGPEGTKLIDNAKKMNFYRWDGTKKWSAGLPTDASAARYRYCF